VRIDGVRVSIPRLREGTEHDEVVLGARPEHITIAADGVLRGEVFGVEYMGARQLVTVDTRAGRLKVRAPNTVPVATGDNVGLTFRTDRLVLFDGRSERALNSDLTNGDARA
jgi:multiple sugar transport system ATP-binding protein